MKAELQTYSSNLDLSKVVSDRIDSIINFYKVVCKQEVLDIFISEYIQDDGSRVYENLWLFTTDYAMEAKSFINTDNFDMVVLRDCVGRWQIEKKDYDFVKATDKSRMVLTFHINEQFGGSLGSSGILKASKDNCDNLKHILIKYIVSNQLS